MTAAPAPTGSPPALVRGLSLLASGAFLVTGMIGTGVFLKARVMTCNVGTPELVLLAWGVAGLLSLAGALVYAELGAMMPRAGGEYVFLNAAYGRVWAFLFGWVRTFRGNAAIAVASVIFLNDLLGGTLAPVTLRLLPVGVIAVATALNLASVTAGGRIATALTAVKVALVLGVGAGAFVLADGAAGHFAMSGEGGTCEGVPASARGGLAGFGAAMLGALYAYDGWNRLTYVGEEVRDPQRNLPRALIGGTLLVIALYVFVNAAYFWVLPPEAVASVPASSSVAAEAARRFLGPAAVAVMAAGMMASSFSALHVGILGTSRVTFAMARDGLGPEALARVSPGARVPAASVLFQGVWSALLALTGSFDALANYTIFMAWVFYGLTGAAVFVLRRKQPDAERPYRAWGYPVVPTLFLLVTAYLLVSTLIATPVQALAGLGLTVLGLPAYAYYTRRARPDASGQTPPSAPVTGTTAT